MVMVSISTAARVDFIRVIRIAKIVLWLKVGARAGGGLNDDEKTKLKFCGAPLKSLAAYAVKPVNQDT